MEILDGFKLCRKGLHQYRIGLNGCPECRKISQREWAKRNPEKVKQKRKTWYDKNREAEIEKSRNWYSKNKEQLKEASRKRSREWAKANKERKKEADQAYYRNNKQKHLENSKKWVQENKERSLSIKRKWAANNKSKVLEIQRKWNEVNRDKNNSRAAKRRALKKQSIPPWAKIEEIEKIYAECDRMTTETGIQHEVDHIYPLQSKYLCGLHVETNLQILTRDENRSKSNKTWPGQLDCQKD